MNSTAKMLIVCGMVLVVLGSLWHLTDGKIPLGRLPGDIRIEKDNVKVFIPFTTGILFSAILSLIAYLFKKQ